MRKRYVVSVGLVLLALCVLAGCGKPVANIFSSKPQVAVRYSGVDFLTEEQAEIYTQAADLFPKMCVSTESWEFAHNGDGYVTREIDGVTYHQITGEYARWEDFTALWLDTFTEEWFAENNHYYREIEGHTWVMVGAKTAQWVAEKSYYEVGFVNEEMIVFYANPQYKDEFAGEDEPVRWQAYYMIQLIQTGDGWRCNRFEV